MDNIALALPLYLSTLPLLFVGMWSLVLALPAAWLQPHVEHERRLMRGFHSIMLGHALICFSYFISNNAMVSMENMTRVMIIGSALATMAVLHGLMYFTDQKRRFLINLFTSLLLFRPRLFYLSLINLLELGREVIFLGTQPWMLAEHFIYF